MKGKPLLFAFLALGLVYSCSSDRNKADRSEGDVQMEEAYRGGSSTMPNGNPGAGTYDVIEAEEETEEDMIMEDDHRVDSPNKEAMDEQTMEDQRMEDEATDLPDTQSEESTEY